MLLGKSRVFYSNVQVIFFNFLEIVRKINFMSVRIVLSIYFYRYFYIVYTIINDFKIKGASTFKIIQSFKVGRR